MPEITCPDCGLTINLENRRRTDFNLIKSATEKRARTFTELLHITRLSRKTLSLRLRELRENGTIVKNNGLYMLNGTSHIESNGKDLVRGFSVRGFSRAFRDRRIRNFAWVLMFLSLSASGYAMALFFATPKPAQTNTEPTIIGYSTLALEINNIEDLYAWQVVIAFNADELKILQVSPGDFMAIDYPLFVNATDIGGDGLLMVGGTLLADTAGISGNGTLATIVLGYYVADYKPPEIAQEQGAFENLLFRKDDASLVPIPIEEQTLTLRPLA